MTIHYKKNEVAMSLFLAIFWLAIGILNFWLFERLLLGITWIVLSGLYFVFYTNQVKNQYLTIEEGMIKQNWPWGKKIKLEEINSIQHAKEKYILKTEKQVMKIKVNLIEGKSLAELNQVLDKLDVEWNDRP
ncbi:hypothetical protein P872_11120 [Rhodonellum psychrophilum GCM71 = DSM 17998]|uniref:DUF5673 domain-containing protein n=2 Tax=Rhodonellum TaxID=336827 RepID=U5BK98_9BACT|nr:MULTISPECIES: hypothetical protein [Rhodonellum]ERM80860.1 hypothetical protein P872_11120 [Rhodonellum psychrophilum GCM71 = DSM 17998]SDZ08835.1 hypothetical protein SAMN05444412_105245 [Rhodonellum ikkaensis]